MSYLLSSYLGVNPVFVSPSHLHVCRCSPHLRSLPHLTLPRQFCQAQDHHVRINTNITTTTVISTKIVFPKDYLKKNISKPKSRQIFWKTSKSEIWRSEILYQRQHQQQRQTTTTTVISTKISSGAIPQNWIKMKAALTLRKPITLININTLRPGLNTGVHDFPLYTGWKFRTFSLKDTYLHFLTGAYFRAANQCWRETKVMFEKNKYIWKPLCPTLMLLLCFFVGI